MNPVKKFSRIRPSVKYALPQIIVACMILLTFLWKWQSDLHGGLADKGPQFAQVAWDPRQTIPLKIWSTIKSRSLSQTLKKTVASWKQLNPSVSWQLDTDQDILHFLEHDIGGDLWGTVKRFMDQDAPAVMLADIWRYAILYKFGGVYSDIDVVCKQPLHVWLPPSHTIDSIPSREYQNMTFDSCSILIGLENDIHFCQWTFASAPGHPILQRTLELIIHRGRHGISFENEDFVHYHTGPAVFTTAIIDVLFQNFPVNYSRNAIQSFRDVWNMPDVQYHVRSTLKACIVGTSFFKNDVAQNLYASQWSDDEINGSFSSWVQDVHKIIHTHDAS